MKSGFIEAKYEKPLKGDKSIDLHSHGNNRTALAIILAAANNGRTELINPLPQPEIIELCTFIDSFVCPVFVEVLSDGALKIIVDGMGNIPISHSGSFSVGPDKCELGFWIAVATITGGIIECHISSPSFVDESLGPLAGINDSLFKRFGIQVNVVSSRDIVIDGQKSKLNPINLVVPHNKELTTGLSIDVCPQFIPLMALAPGKSYYRDCKYGSSRVSIFLDELRKFGVVASLRGQTLEVQGSNELHGANVVGFDIRGAATLLISSLAAYGTSEICGIFHVNRGYSDIIAKLTKVNARIKRKGIQS